MGEQVADEPESAEHALVGDDPQGLKESHGGGVDVVDDQAVLL
jgi:hypothetical protein